ncbi:MAG: cation:proton antiporter [Sulfolobus sp.]
MQSSSNVVYLTLLELFTLLTIAQTGRLFTEKYFLPAIVTEIFIGIALSPYALGGVINNLLGVDLFSLNSYLQLFADFSVVLLIFASGLSHGFKGLKSSGFLGFVAATTGAVLPTYLVYSAFSLIYRTEVAALMGAASAATSLAATASVIEEYRLYRERFSRLLISAAALDDVVSLVILTVVLEVVTLRALTVTGVIVSLIESIIAWLIILLTSVYIIPKAIKYVRDELVSNVSLVILFILVLIMLILGFSPVVAAFIAGVAIAESVKISRVNEFTNTLLTVFGPIFFIYVGMETPAFDFLNLNTVLLGLLMTALAIIGKVGGIFPVAYLYTRNLKEAFLTSIGMIPRGEVGLIVATLGLSSGILNGDEYSQIILMALLTTIIGGILFVRLADRWVLKRSKR